MAKNTEHVQHVKSNVVLETGKPKLPLAGNIVEGEIAINYADGVETISIKNSNSDIVTFSSDNYYSEQKLGSGFTGENSGVTVTDTILWVSGTGENSVVLKGSSGTASGDYSVAEGYQTSGTGFASHAEGQGATASGNYSHAEGHATAIGDTSHAEGGGRAIGTFSHAEGSGQAIGSYSHAEGHAIASGDTSHAEGNGQAIGSYSHAEGQGAIASGNTSHAEGQSTIASGETSHAEGYYTTANGTFSHAEGYRTVASGSSSHAEGYETSATEPASHAEGRGTKANGMFSHAEGHYTTANGQASHAEGSGTTASGTSSHAEGNNTIASGSCSHAEGNGTSAIGNNSHAEGGMGHGGFSGPSKAIGDNSHAEGGGTESIGNNSHSEGTDTVASGTSSHAEGYNTTASGPHSHAEGALNVTNNYAEHASGQYNISTSASTEFGNSGNTLFSVGNGNFLGGYKHNAFEIRQNGDIYIVNTDDTSTSKYDEKPMVRLQDHIGSSITVDQVIDGGTSASTNAVSTKAVYGFVTSYTPSITVDQVLDDTTSTSTNPVSSKAVYKAVTDNELVWTNAYVALSGTVSAHTANTEIHVTAADKEKLHTHSNKASLDSITGNVGTMAYEDKTSYSSATEVNTVLGNKANTSDLAAYADSVKYNSTTHYVEFYHGTTAGTKVFEYDASPFIIDGMVQNVEIKDVTSGGSQVTCLVVSFNTDAGKQDINVPISDIFDASNYYNKAAIDNLVGSGFTSSSITDVIIENEEIVSAALTDLDDRKLDASAYTPTDLSNYYTKSETSGATQISNALGAKVNSATYTAHTADTSIHFTTGEVQTQIDNSISGKVNTSDIVSVITPSNSGSTDPIATKVVAENELTVSNALNDLNARVALLEAALGGMKLVKLTSAQYEALTTKDPNTLYIIND